MTRQERNKIACKDIADACEYQMEALHDKGFSRAEALQLTVAILIGSRYVPFADYIHESEMRAGSLQ